MQQNISHLPRIKPCSCVNCRQKKKNGNFYFACHIWIQNEKCFQMSTNMPSIGSSGVATGGARGEECHPWQRKKCQKEGKRGKNQEKLEKKEEKSGRKGKNRAAFFTFPLLTDGAGYATDWFSSLEIALLSFENTEFSSFWICTQIRAKHLVPKYVQSTLYPNTCKAPCTQIRAKHLTL